MNKKEIMSKVFEIMDTMDMRAEEGKETDMQEFDVDSQYSIAVECDVLVDHVDWYKVYIKENGDYVENVTVYHTSSDKELQESVSYLLGLRNLGE